MDTEVLLSEFCKKNDIQVKKQWNGTYVLTHDTGIDYYLNSAFDSSEYLDELALLSSEYDLTLVGFQFIFEDCKISSKYIDMLTSITILYGGISMNNCILEKKAEFNNTIVFMLLQNINYQYIDITYLAFLGLHVYDKLTSVDIDFLDQINHRVADDTSIQLFDKTKLILKSTIDSYYTDSNTFFE